LPTNWGTSDRRVWDLGRRVFDETNPNLPGLFLFGHHFERYFERWGKKWSHKNRLGIKRRCRNCRNSSGSLKKYFFVNSYWTPNPDVPISQKKTAIRTLCWALEHLKDTKTCTVCLGWNHHFMLGSQIKASEPLQNDLKSGQRHRHDLSVWRWVLVCPSKTKKWGQTPDPKCRKVDLYREMACVKFSGIYSPCSRRPLCTGFLIPIADGSLVLGIKKLRYKTTRGRGQKKSQTRIYRSNFHQFSPIFGRLGPPSKNSKCHNSINIGS